MFRPSILSILVTLNCFLHVSAGPVSLYIPTGAIGEGQLVTADPIGTDSVGYTTWRIGQGVHSGAFTSSLLATATLVIGSTDAHLFMAASSTTVREDCVFATGASGGPPLAFCLEFSTDPTLTTTVAVVETVLLKEVQVSAETAASGGLGWSFAGLLSWTQTILTGAGLSAHAAWHI